MLVFSHELAMKPFTDRIFYLDDDSIVHIHYADGLWIMYRLSNIYWKWLCSEVSYHYDTLYAHIAARNPELLLQEPL